MPEKIEWFKSEEDKDEAKRLADKAFVDVQKREDGTAMGSIDEAQAGYIDQVFPKTNDDTMRDDQAERLLFKGYGHQEKAEELEAVGNATEGALNEKLWKEYELASKVDALNDSIKILKLNIDINPRFNLAKSGTSPEDLKNEVLATLSEFEAEANKLKASLKDSANP